MKLIDTHAHLTWPDFKIDFNEVIKNAQDAGLKTVINIGADLQSSKEAAELDCSPLTSYSSIGIHPEDSLKLITDESIHKSIEELEKIYHSHPEKVIAVGECGLEYYPDDPTPEQKNLQMELFTGQVNLAKKLQLPLIIHCRDAWNDIFLPELNGLPVVFHYFTGNKETAQKILDMGFYLSFSCVITYPKNEWLREIIKITPLEQMFAETDSPFSSPQGKRGTRNEPANVLDVIKTIAQVKKISEEEVAIATWNNAHRFFQLPT